MHDKGFIGAGALVDLVSDFYTASMDGRFWSTALAKLREALDAGACALAAHDFAASTAILHHSVGIDVGMVQTYADVHGRNSPWLEQEEPFRIAGNVFTDAELVEASTAQASDFVRQWLLPQGFRHQIFGALDRQGTRLLFLYAARTPVAGPFGEDAVALLKRLLPYLQRGLRAGQLLQRTQSARQVALDALDGMPIGVILVSGSGAVLGANRAARDAMSERDVFTVTRSGLEFQREGRRVLMRDMIGSPRDGRLANRSAQPMAFSLERPTGQRSLTVLVWSVAESEEPGTDDPAAVVFLGDPDRPADVDESRLRQLYGLTGAEARVAALLARGYRLDEIAEMLGVAYETTRKHLKQIFGKTNTARQAELVRMVMTGPGGLRI